VDWADYIAGKTVAVVGPAAPAYDQSADIDAHDVVIRIGWVSADRCHPWYGSKVNVGFYNLAASRYWSGTRRANVDRLDWVLAKADYGLVDSVPSRQVGKVDGINANQVPLILHDLSLFGPGPVSVFGADFYWNADGLYTDEYVATTSEAKPSKVGKPVSELLNGHDWDRQRQVCRDAMGRLDVVGDERFLRVVMMDDDEYRDGMLQTYPGLTC
jgi:hypothetical protein